MDTYHNQAIQFSANSVPPKSLVATYNRLLAEDPDVSMPVAAIEALIELLSHITTSTVYETVEIVRAQIAHLKASVPNPIPPTAGAELFTRTLLKCLRQDTTAGRPAAAVSSGNNNSSGSRLASNSQMSFDELRQYLVRNSRGFAAQAKAARAAIADVGARYVRGGETVMTAGGSRCVQQLFLRAAERRAQLNGCPDFRVVYVLDEQDNNSDGKAAVAALRERGVPVATVDVASMAHALQLGRVDRVFVGAEAVCQRGGVLSRMGTYQLALAARDHNTEFYVVTETHKFAMVLPLDQADVAKLGVKQNILEFKKGGGGGAEEDTATASGAKKSENLWRADYTVSTFFSPSPLPSDPQYSCDNL